MKTMLRHPSRCLVCLLLPAMVSALGAAEDPDSPSPRAAQGRGARSIESHLGLTYSTYGDRTLELDLFRPSEGGMLPAIVGIHGGGWEKGTRANFGATARGLASRGFVAVAISYRLSGEAPFPAQIHDCKAAVRWLRANADRYGIDSRRIGVIGHSAGGHLAALLATSGGVVELEGAGGNPQFSSSVQAAVAMGAQTDLESPRVRLISANPEQGAIWRRFLGGSQVDRATLYQLASPLHHLDPKDPPLAFITGESDDPSTRADSMRQRLASNGIATGLTVIPGAPHSFLGNQTWFAQAMEAATGFFNAHLRTQ